jgi:Mg-chelatase subunit ChlD
MLQSKFFRLPVFFTLAVAVCSSFATAQQPAEGHSTKKPAFLSPGEKNQVSLFGVKAEGSKFVYVLDRSGSTDGKLLATAKAEILASIESIDDVHQFQLVVYNERPKAFNPAGSGGQLAFGTDANREEVKKFLSTISGDGGTDHAAALSMAIRMRPDVIFLLSDGDDPKLTAHDLERIDRIGAGVIINTVQFGEGRKLEHGFMEKLAKQSGGEYKFVDTTKLGKK